MIYSPNFLCIYYVYVLHNTEMFQIAFYKPKGEKVAIKRIDLDKTQFSIEEVIKEVNVSIHHTSVYASTFYLVYPKLYNR